MGLTIGGLSIAVGSFIMQSYFIEDLKSTTRLVSSQVHAAVYRSGDDLVDIVKSDTFEKYYHTQRKVLLLPVFQDYNRIFQKLVYINEKGIQEISIVKERADTEEKPFENTEGYQMALGRPNTLVVGAVDQDLDLEERVIRFYYHQIDFFDNNLGVIQGSVTLTRLAQSIDKLFRGEERHSVFITDPSGNIIYGHQKGNPGESLNEDWFSFDSRSEETGTDAFYMGKKKLWGESYLVGAIHLVDPQWHVFVIKLSQLTTNILYSFLLWILLGTVFVMICGEMISRRLGLQITEPIKQFRMVTADVLEDGDLEKRVEWKSEDEMGRLVDSFNAMLKKISDTQYELKIQQQFNVNIINSMTDVMIVVSSQWEIIKINPNVCDLFGYEKNEVIGQKLDFLIEGDRRLLLDDNRIQNKKVFLIPEQNLVASSKEQIPLSLSISVLTNHHGESMGYLITGRDLREELRFKREKKLADEKLQIAQEELFKTEKLAIVGQMSGLIAHEILNPVSAVYARLDLMIKEEKSISRVHQLLHEIIFEWKDKMGTDKFDVLVEEKGQKDMELLGKIADAVLTKEAEQSESRNFIFKLIQRITHIVNNLREMARREKNLEQVALVKLINEVIRDQEDGLRKRGIEVKREYGANPSIYADYMETYSIFANLFKNCVQAIESNTARPEKEIHIYLRQKQDKIRVQIKDTGTGIDLESQNKLFQLGFSTKGREGTGIGLSHSRKIARQLGGDLILLKSKPGRGTTFQVNFNCEGNEDVTKVE